MDKCLIISSWIGQCPCNISVPQTLHSKQRMIIVIILCFHCFSFLSQSDYVLFNLVSTVNTQKDSDKKYLSSDMTLSKDHVIHCYWFVQQSVRKKLTVMARETGSGLSNDLQSEMGVCSGQILFLMDQLSLSGTWTSQTSDYSWQAMASEIKLDSQLVKQRVWKCPLSP